jgi:phosphoglycolate phosphatase
MKFPFQAILFDFDGTLVQSNQIKRDTLFVVARTTGAADEQFAQVLNERPRDDRFGLYRELLVRMGYTGDLNDKVNELAQLYADLTTEAISKAPEIPGAEEFLKKHSSDLPMYINSATPEASLRNTVEECGWTGFFRGIYGRPKTKTDIFKTVQNETRLTPEQILFVGDSLQDLETARTCGCPFLGIAAEPGWICRFPDKVPFIGNYLIFNRTAQKISRKGVLS